MAGAAWACFVEDRSRVPQSAARHSWEHRNEQREKLRIRGDGWPARARQTSTQVVGLCKEVDVMNIEPTTPEIRQPAARMRVLLTIDEVADLLASDHAMLAMMRASVARRDPRPPASAPARATIC